MLTVFGDDVTRKFGNLHISGIVHHAILVARRARGSVEFVWQGVHVTVTPDATIDGVLDTFRGQNRRSDASSQPELSDARQGANCLTRESDGR